MRIIMYSSDTSSAHCELDWLIYFVEKDKGLDMEVAGDVQATRRAIDLVFMLWPQTRFNMVRNIAS